MIRPEASKIFPYHSIEKFLTVCDRYQLHSLSILLTHRLHYFPCYSMEKLFTVYNPGYENMKFVSFRFQDGETFPCYSREKVLTLSNRMAYPIIPDSNTSCSDLQGNLQLLVGISSLPDNQVKCQMRQDGKTFPCYSREKVLTL